MTVAAVMLVKDEADIIETTIRHLLWHVDEVLVADNMSTDGTRDILQSFVDGRQPVRWFHDEEVGYYQDRKTTALAMDALALGHSWVLPCDADEIWHHGNTKLPIRDYLAGLGPDVMVIQAKLFNHLPSLIDDPDEPNPVKRIRWRQRHPGMTKVVCRLRPDLRIDMGNHGARHNGKAATIEALNVRHFSWRTEDQYLRKIVNGRAAYAVTNLPAHYGTGWRNFDGASDESIRANFRDWFTVPTVEKREWTLTPHGDTSLIEDPAPLRG